MINIEARSTKTNKIFLKLKIVVVEGKTGISNYLLVLVTMDGSDSLRGQ